MNKTYYKITYKLLSPLSIGGSDNYRTNNDVICGKNGLPFIPATSLCGVYRDFFELSEGNELFGYFDSTGKAYESNVKVYDGYLKDNTNAVIAVRDSNKLDKYNTGNKNKFDAQIIEMGAEFVTYIELDGTAYQPQIEKMLGNIKCGDLFFGSKTSRGFGKLGIKKCQRRSFTDVDKWLDFDMFNADCWDDNDIIELNSNGDKYTTLLLELQLLSGVSVREYTTEAFVNKLTKEIETGPDYQQLVSKSINKPVIPGTSWAGVFRDHIREFADDSYIDKLFGVADNEKKQKSKIVFSESTIDNSSTKIITRNSIDRFSAATKDGALYTEKATFYGDLKLEIKVEKNFLEIKDGKEIPTDLTPLAACVLDLSNGLLNVGGLTSVGRGIFKVEKAYINGKETTAVKDCNLKLLSEQLSTGEVQ